MTRERRPAPTAPAAAWRVAFAVAVAVNLALLYWPRPVSDGGLPHVDKLVHLVTFAALAWTGLRALLPPALLLPLLVVHAVSSEAVQQLLLARRTGDVADAVADCAGVLAGTLLARASWSGERTRVR